MIAGLRSTFFLMLSLAFFMVILGLLTLGLIMSPDRWGRRPRPLR